MSQDYQFTRLFDDGSSLRVEPAAGDQFLNLIFYERDREQGLLQDKEQLADRNPVTKKAREELIAALEQRGFTISENCAPNPVMVQMKSNLQKHDDETSESLSGRVMQAALPAMEQAGFLDAEGIARARARRINKGDDSKLDPRFVAMRDILLAATADGKTITTENLGDVSDAIKKVGHWSRNLVGQLLKERVSQNGSITSANVGSIIDYIQTRAFFGQERN